MLEFLKPVIEEHILSSNVPTDDDSTQDSTHTESYSIPSTPTVTERHISTKEVNNDDTDQNKELLEILKQRNQKEDEFMKDEDTLFALSLDERALAARPPRAYAAPRARVCTAHRARARGACYVLSLRLVLQSRVSAAPSERAL
ncbi:hypothetical protein ACJJTC_010521 [Scirpophaga incertulas]